MTPPAAHWIRFLRNYGPLPTNGNLFDEHINAALKRAQVRPIELPTPTVDAMAESTNDLLREDMRQLLQTAQVALDSVEQAAASAGLLVEDNRAAISTFSNQGLRQVGPTVLELRETLRSLKQLSDKLGASDSLLLGRDQPKEYQPR